MSTRSERPSRLGDVLKSLLARLPAGNELADYDLWMHWDDALGTPLAAHARPHRLRRGVLVVAVDSSEWMQEVQFLKHDIRARLNARLGREVVKGVFVVLAVD
jgi:predicted nucleic acid-binding Zn ribbon protein